MDDIALSDLQTEIEAGWAARETLGPDTRGPVRTAVEETLRRLDAGEARVAEKVGGAWEVRPWLKQAILLSFRLSPNTVIRAGALGGGIGPWWDKIPGKFDGWDEARFEAAGFRAVPGAIVRHGAFIGRDAVLMPSFVNIGAHVGERTMIDTWATVGSCAQIGAGV
ncbi:MAG: 2,3,4,5-tetrahydropyridine-2,6-dicarboxylate N-succinyltransferase, partial [Caulobacteraceae bacterium]